jgi:hypothetical protein
VTLNSKTSSDQISYKVAGTPCEIPFSAENYCGVTETPDGYKFHHLFVKCEELRTRGLPLDANPREPTRAKVVREMADTLQNHPENFHHWNNGITIICDGVKTSDASILFTFNAGSGVCNGGHTYFTINTFPSEIHGQAFVHLEAVELPSTLNADERVVAINKIAKFRNANRALLPSTQADFLGFYDPFKNALADSSPLVRWHEGDSDAVEDAISSETLIRMLAAIDPLWFNHPIHSPSKDNHKSAATSANAIHSRWLDGQNDPESNLRHLAHMTRRIFAIAEMISLTIRNAELGKGFRNSLFYQWLAGSGEKLTSIYSPGQSAIRLPNPALIMMLGAFRTNICVVKNEDGYPSHVGFLDDPERLWNNNFNDYLEKLRTMFKDKEQAPLLFVKSDGPYDEQLITLEHGRHPPSRPSLLIDVNSGCTYHLVDEIGEASHELQVDSSWHGNIVPVESTFNKNRLYRSTL